MAKPTSHDAIIGNETDRENRKREKYLLELIGFELLRISQIHAGMFLRNSSFYSILMYISYASIDISME